MNSAADDEFDTLAEEENEFDEDEDDEEEEEELINTKKRKADNSSTSKSKKRGRKKAAPPDISSFFETEAQENEDEDEEEDDEDAGFDQYADEATEAIQAQRQIDIAARQRAEHTMSQVKRAGGTGYLESAVGALEKRFEGLEFDEDLYEDEDGDVNQNKGNYEYSEYHDTSILMSTDTDSKLWLVRLYAKGKEKFVCFTLAKKAQQHSAANPNGPPFPIKSAFVSENVKDRIYVEADSPHDVLEGLQDIHYVARTRVEAVPAKDMQQVFLVQPKAELKKNSWARIRRGRYKGDLCLVDSVDVQQGLVTVKLIPRIDWDEAVANQLGHGKSSKPGIKYSFSNRPMARPFLRSEVEQLGGHLETERTHNSKIYLRFGSHLFEELTGLLVKVVPMKFLLSESRSVRPTTAEIRVFDQLSALQGRVGNTTSTEEGAEFRRGEAVRIIRGEMKSLIAKVVEMEGNTVLVDIPEQDIVGISLQKDDITKHYLVGDSVRAIKGPNKGDSGLVAHVDDVKRVATVFSAATIKTFECPLEHLESAPCNSISNRGLSSAVGYSLDELVKLSKQGDAGMIIHINANKEFKVLTTENEVKVLQPADLSISLSASVSSQAVDCQGNIVAIRDKVVVEAGKDKGISGRVAHIYKGFLFIKTNTNEETGGNVCAEVKNVRLCKGVQLMTSSSTTPSSNTPSAPMQTNFTNPAAKMGTRPIMFRAPRDHMVGKHVKIQTGRKKGYHGKIQRPAGPNFYYVQLQAGNGVEKVHRNYLETTNASGGLGVWKAPHRRDDNIRPDFRQNQTTSQNMLIPSNQTSSFDVYAPMSQIRQKGGHSSGVASATIARNSRVKVKGGQFVGASGVVDEVVDRDDRRPLCHVRLQDGSDRMIAVAVNMLELSA
eukprot:GHVP01051775.1.p1 GENE.GHVP01051775.1~~GHVP01051775.1.p1  ORF type:complete len:887 (+),score=153.71 GHVP01051775.1:835-3495(+)